jgi:hypothetical protein
MEVVSPGLSEVFPGMRCGISRYKVLLPIGWCGLDIMPRKCSLIVLPVITEHSAASIEFASVAYQKVLIMVSDLVAEVTEQRAIGLVHLASPLFTLNVVGLHEGYGNDAIFMPVITLGPVPAGGSAGKSNSRPCAGSTKMLPRRSQIQCPVIRRSPWRCACQSSVADAALDLLDHRLRRRPAQSMGPC